MDGLTSNALANDAASRAAAQRAERIADLREMRQMGMRMARQVVLQALGPEPEPGQPEVSEPEPVPPEAALMFARLSNAVRHIVAAEEKIDAAAWAREQPRKGGTARRVWRNPKRDLLKRMVETSILENPDPGANGRLMEELHDALEDPGLDAQFVERRMADVATEICEKMGIRPQLRKFTDAELDYTIEIDRSGWPDKPKLPKGMIGEPGIPSLYEIREREAGRPWPPPMGRGPPR